MNINLNINVRSSDFESINKKLDLLMGRINSMSLQFDELVAKVDASIGAQESAIVLLAGLKQAIEALKDSPTPEAIQALADKVGAETEKLAAAVAANSV